MKKITNLLLIAILISGFAVLSETAVFSQRKDVNKQSSQKSAEANVEDTNVIIKVIGVEDDFSQKRSETEVPSFGKYIAVQIVVDNSGGKEDWEVSANCFKLKDAKNNTFETAFWEVASPKLNDGIVDASDSVSGWITFEIHEDTDIKSLKLRYERKSSILSKPLKSGWMYFSAVK